MNNEFAISANAPPRATQREVTTPAPQATKRNTPRETEPSVTTTSKPIEPRELEKAVQKLSDFVASKQSEISFSIDESSGTRVVKILDRASKEVIRQIPSEEAVAMAQVLDKIQGLLIKDKA